MGLRKSDDIFRWNCLNSSSGFLNEWKDDIEIQGIGFKTHRTKVETIKYFHNKMSLRQEGQLRFLELNNNIHKLNMSRAEIYVAGISSIYFEEL